MAIDSRERPAPIGPSWPEWTRPSAPPSPVALGIVGLAAVAFDLAMRSNPAGIVGAIFVVLLAGALTSTTEMVNPQARALAALAVVFGGWLAVRDSSWLVPFNVLAAGGCLVAAASLARSGSVIDISAPDGVLRTLHAGINGALGLGYIGRGRGRRLAPVLRGLAIAVPLALILGLLLAAGDAVFASAFDFDTGDLVPHLILLLVGAWIAAGLIRVARTPSMERPRLVAPRLGATEWTIVLATLDVLYAGFVVAKIVAATAGGRRVLDTAGLTYAEYARSGFFELLAAAAITLVALLALRASAETSEGKRSRFVALASAAVLLTIVVVASAFQRLALYERAFGLSLLRLYSMVFCIWLVIALVCLGLWIAGVGGRRPWFWSVSLATALVLLLALDVANPEALVIRHNAARANGAAGFDIDYATDLSADAIPAVRDVVTGLDGSDGSVARARLCSMKPGSDDWAGFNLARARGREVLDDFCR